MTESTIASGASSRTASKTLAVAWLAASALSGALRATEVRGRIVDAESGKPIAARLHVEASDGAACFAKSAAADGSAIVYDKTRGTSAERHTTLSAHDFVIDLPAGKFRFTAERGKEYLRASREVEVAATPLEIQIELRRFVDMAARGWYSGETHVHRSIEEMSNLLPAEDLNVAFPLTYWVTRSGEVPATSGADPISGRGARATRDSGRWESVDATHVFWPRNTEYEIFSVDGKQHPLGAVFLIRHRNLFAAGVPPVAPIAKQARAEGALIELDKHNWPWSMALVPVMDADLFELSNNHIWRTDFLFKGWGEAPAAYMNADASTERGWIEFGHRNYWALLDCGFRLRPTAGTASGVHPVPLGFGRVYVELPGGFDPEAWVRGLDAGRSFVTTGPLLFATVDGRAPGARIEIAGATGRGLRVRGECLSAEPPSALEIIAAGEIVRRLDPRPEKMDSGAYRATFDETLPLEGSTWVAVRAFAELDNGRPRFAHTSPVHVDVPGRPLRPRREEVEYLATRVREQITRSRGVISEESLAEYERALARYEALLSHAR